ncbi:LysR family transcriptional regulator [Pseudochelatococcus sp. B33]
MNLRHLRHFVAVAEELHFTRAAERAGIEQSPLSRSIKNLETRLGVVLFERTKRSTRLTPAGERLFHHARALLIAADEAKADLRKNQGTQTQHLHVGICDGIPMSRVVRLIAALRETRPDICVHIHEVSMTQKVEDLRSGFLDVALAPESGYGRSIIAEAIWQDQPAALIPRSHSLATRDRLFLTDIIAEPLVLCRYDTGLGQQCQIEQIVRRATPTPNIVDRAPTLCMLVMLVVAGYGVGIVTAAQLEAIGSDDLVLRPFCDTPAEVRTWLMMREEASSEPLSRFVELARKTT